MLECFSASIFYKAVLLYVHGLVSAFCLLFSQVNMLMHGLNLFHGFFQIDMQLESGEYFMSDKKKSEKKWQEKQEKQTEKSTENKRKRDASFLPPEVSFLT